MSTFNTGVPKQQARINPEGIEAPIQAAGVSQSVPFVQPVNTAQMIDPNQTGAMRLARQLGNINFGALANSFGANQGAKKALREEQERSTGLAETAKLLAETGSDLETLVRTGRIPASKSPNFQLGMSQAAAGDTLNDLRLAIKERRMANPEAVPFDQDTQFMSRFYQKLGGVRNEAVVKQFYEPMQALIADDQTNLLKVQDEKQTTEYMNQVVGGFEKSIRLGDPLAASLNNAVNTMKASGRKNSASMAVLINSAGDAILDSSKGADGKIDSVRVGRLLEELGSTAIFADNDRILAKSYHKEYVALSNEIFNRIHIQSQAYNEQQTAKQIEGSETYANWLIDASKKNPDGSLTLPTVSASVSKARELGLDPDRASKIYKAWDGTGGNVNAVDESDEKFKASQTQILSEMNAVQRQEYVRSMALRGLTAKRYIQLTEVAKSVHTSDPKSAIRPQEITTIRDAMAGQIPYMFQTAGSTYSAQLYAAAHSNGRSGIGADLQKAVTDRVTNLAMDWARQQPDFQLYEAAKLAVDGQPGAPAQQMQHLMNQFVQQNGKALGTALKKALTSPNPVGAINSLKLETQQAPSQFPNIQKLQQQMPKPSGSSPSPKPAEHNPQAHMQQVTKSKLNLMDVKSPAFQWYASYVRGKNPSASDTDVINRIKRTPAQQILKIQQRFIWEQQHGQ